MMTPRVVVPEVVRAALLNASKMHNTAVELGQLTALPSSGLPETVGVQSPTLLRAMNGKLVPEPSARLCEAWYQRSGRFLPEVQ